MNAKTISVIGPVSEAIERTKIILFRPFNLEKWLVIGFCAWLAGFIQGGLRGGFNYRYNKRDFDEFNIPPKVLDFISTHTLLVAVAICAIVFLFITVMLLLLWLNSRGKFMFLDCLAKNKAHISEPWRKFQKQANSLMAFRIMLMAILVVFLMPLGIITLWLTSYFSDSGVSSITNGLIILGITLLIFIITAVLGVVQLFTLDFVVPIMYIQQIGVFSAWKKFLPLLGQSFWKIMLYLFFKILIIFCIGVITLLIIGLGCCCCCIGLIFFIPYIGTVLLLPLSSFIRFYSLCFLRQFGSEYDVFPAGM